MTLRERLKAEAIRDGRIIGTHADDYKPDFVAPRSPGQVVVPGIGNTRIRAAEHSYPTPTRHVTRGIERKAATRPRATKVVKLGKGSAKVWTDAELRLADAAIEAVERKHRIAAASAHIDHWSHKA
jgi:hypothetical protein